MPAARLLLALLIVTSSFSVFAASATPNASSQHLSAFQSERAFQDYLKKLKQQEAKQQQAYAKENAGAAADMIAVPSPPSPPATLQKVEVTGSKIADSNASKESDGITNVQTQGVDEGGIVKKLDEYLIVLRRGRLFTIKANASQLQAVSTINAYGPGISPDGAWYDEMLISGRTVIVVGYSYARGGTEIGLFRVSETGQLSYRNTYHLRSNDYFSARNFASRLIGNQLIFYSPMSLNLYGNANDSLPAVRAWQKTPGAFKRILPAERIYQSGQSTSSYDLTLHSVTTCTISDQSNLDCKANAVLGPSSRVFYVSSDAVYVWVGPESSWYGDARKPNASMLLRMPLNGQSPQALRVSGNPIDQLSFLERAGYLNVLVGSRSNGDGMWRSEGKAGSLALLRVPLRAFGSAGARSQEKHYRPVPAPFDYGLQNRFVGDWLIVGSGYQHKQSSAFAIPYARAGQAVELDLQHSTERIEALGNDAVVIGSSGNDLVFSSIRLDNKATPVAGYIQRNAVQSESRTHGFFYQAQDTQSGILGLPILGGGDERPTAAVKYLRNKNLQLSDMGLLVAAPNARLNDNCKASCVDWYGNARPIFIGNRVYALMGYELVEGCVAGDSIVELRRVDYTPRAAR